MDDDDDINLTEQDDDVTTDSRIQVYNNNDDDTTLTDLLNNNNNIGSAPAPTLDNQVIIPFTASLQSTIDQLEDEARVLHRLKHMIADQIHRLQCVKYMCKGNGVLFE
ncbi:hypothetical protein DFA_01635 [Cavenderia fasciculata]|uniref:Uncharacterized protein n=1 Tax=Cavenderia fasciculata TaxID=261658 RepID=F4PTY1_CACFS|nr:uncharacterized protein DFA_01635 [Cavenderia fasciculata]EGG21749.1 hypothetical protein DFA_01635 [Cavenderia fasciculata]|eukprot:XP_004359599.1 hypothetical protein DFA_01635 [Cavenderia fasciculata]